MFCSKVEKPTCRYEIWQADEEGTVAELVVIIENKKSNTEAHAQLLAACDSEGRIYFSAERSNLPRASRSSGYGSTIVCRCVNLMHGECYLEVSPTSTKFIFRVPTCVQSELSSGQPATTTEVSDDTVPLSSVSGLRFGIVDDQRVIASTCKSMVRVLMEGSCIWFEPDCTMEELVQRICDHPMDIVLVDQNLGPFKGSDLIKRLNRMTCEFNGLAISYTGDEDADGYSWPTITKNVRGPAFVDRVQHLWSTFLASKPLAKKEILLVDDKDLHVRLEQALLNKVNLPSVILYFLLTLTVVTGTCQGHKVL